VSELTSVGAVKTLDLVLLELAMHRDRGEFFQKKKKAPGCFLAGTVKIFLDGTEWL